MAGNSNSGRKDKPITDALRLACHRVHEGDPQGRKKLQVLADDLVEGALAGDFQKAREVMDRLEGKPAQYVESDHTDRIVIEEVRYSIVEPQPSLEHTNGAGLPKPH